LVSPVKRRHVERLFHGKLTGLRIGSTVIVQNGCAKEQRGVINFEQFLEAKY